MRITEKAWAEYVARLARLCERAGQEMAGYLEQHGTADAQAVAAYACALVQKYGAGSAELSCQMYDAVAALAGAAVPPAEPAAPAEYGEVAGMVHSVQGSGPLLQSGVKRFVKRAGADTTLQNALRDGAEFAWVPHGDSCAFCLTLASRGWQRASKKALKNGHAEHIHPNCDCEYAVRFDGKSGVAGYDPEEYLAQYNAAGGDINALRRAQYAKSRERINAQKRAAYAARMERQAAEKRAQSGLTDVLSEYLERATPGTGSITYGDGYKTGKHQDEIKTAQWLHDHLGGNIVLLSELNKNRQKTADYLWNEKFWELKGASSINAVDKRLQDAIKQIQDNPGGVILKVPENIDVEALARQIASRANRSNIAEFDILVLTNEVLAAVFRHKK